MIREGVSGFRVVGCAIRFEVVVGQRYARVNLRSFSGSVHCQLIYV